MSSQHSAKHTLCGQAVGTSEGFRGSEVHCCEGIKTPLSSERVGVECTQMCQTPATSVDPPLFSWEDTGCVGR